MSWNICAIRTAYNLFSKDVGERAALEVSTHSADAAAADALATILIRKLRLRLGDRVQSE